MSTKYKWKSYLISLPQQKAPSRNKEKSRASFPCEPVKSKFQTPKRQISNKFEISNHKHKKDSLRKHGLKFNELTRDRKAVSYDDYQNRLFCISFLGWKVPMIKNGFGAMK